MSWKGAAHKVYEAQVVKDALGRLAEQFKSLPFSEAELETLARRARESFRSRKTERLEKYKAHLSAIHGRESVETVSTALEKINNAIGYEEK